MGNGLHAEGLTSQKPVSLSGAMETLGTARDATAGPWWTDLSPDYEPSLPRDVSVTTSGVQEAMIRALDLVGAVGLLIVALPAILLSVVLIRLTSRGPVIYKQNRVGRKGKVFVLYKFRTMVRHAEQVWGLLPASEDDIRVTPVGRVLRRTRIDELPQLLNVLRGDMSLVGPRPENLYRVSLHKALQGARLAVRPGLTGLAQVRSFYDLKPEHKLKYDYLYIQKRSLRLNLYILAKTIPVVLKKTGW